MSERRILCPTCMGAGNAVGCPCWDGTIPDRRKPTPADRAVERILAMSSHASRKRDDFNSGYDMAVAAIQDIIREEAERE